MWDRFKRWRKARKRAKAAGQLAYEIVSGMGGTVDPLPPEPSEGYLETLDVLDNIVRDCSHVSRCHGGILTLHGREYFASLLFTAMVTKSVSLISLAPFSPWADKLMEHWDYASLTGIARSLMELRLTFYYLCVDDVPEAEWQCRWQLFNLHDCTSRLRLFKAQAAMSDEDQSDEIGQFEATAEELRQDLAANVYFGGLPEKQRKALLKGEKAYLLALEEIANASGFGREKYRFFNVLLSSHVHSLPMSFYRIGDRGRGLPSPVEEGYTTMMLSLAAALLTAARDEFLEVFKGRYPGDITPDEFDAGIRMPRPRPEAVSASEE